MHVWEAWLNGYVNLDCNLFCQQQVENNSFLWDILELLQKDSKSSLNSNPIILKIFNMEDLPIIT